MIAVKVTLICALFCVFNLDGACCARLKRQVQKPEEQLSSQEVPFNEDGSNVSNEDMNIDDYDSILSFFNQPLEALSPFESSTKNRDTSNESPVEVSASNTKSPSEEVFLTKESDSRPGVTKSTTSKENKDPSSTSISNNESVSSNDEDSSEDSSSSQSTSTKSKDCSSSESSSSDSKDSSSTSSNSEDSSSSKSIPSKNEDSSSSESTSSNSKDSSSDSSSSESTSSNSKNSSPSTSISSNDKSLPTDSSKSTSSSSENSDDSSTEEEEKSIEKDISDDEPAKETLLNPRVQGMNIALYYILQNLNRRMLFDQKIEFQSLAKVLALTYKIERAGGTVIDFNELMLKNIIGAFPKAFRDALNADSNL